MKQGEEHKTRNPDPSVSLWQHSKQFPQPTSHPCTSDSGSLSDLPALTRSASGRSPVLMRQEGCSSSAWAGTHGCCRLILCCWNAGGAQLGARGCPSPSMPDCVEGLLKSFRYLLPLSHFSPSCPFPISACCRG